MPGVLDGTITPPAADSLIGRKSAVDPSTLRDFTDAPAARKAIYKNVLDEARRLQPVENKIHTLALTDVDYEDPDDYSLKDQKRAILEGRTLGRRLRGTWTLAKKDTGEPVETKRLTIAQVPHMTQRGTFILNGTEYTLASQSRLRPGVFTRVKENGEIESHVNVMPGKGLSHRIALDPETSVFTFNLRQGKAPLMPVLKAMGLTDTQIRNAWGNDLFSANVVKDDATAVNKLFDRLTRNKTDVTDPLSRAKAVAETLAAMELDPEVTKRTLGQAFDRISPEAYLATTRKLVAVHKGEEDSDDRDHMAYQTTLGPEDLIAERMRTAGRILRPVLWKASFKNSLSTMNPGFLTKSIMAAITGSGLGQPIEEVNPSEMLDQLGRVSRLGEGGIPNRDAIPDESRSVQPSQFGFIDTLRTPESFAAGVDTRFSSVVRKGPDGRVYIPFRNPRTGESEWLSPQDVADKKITFPGELSGGRKHIAAMLLGRFRRIRRRDADYVLPDMESNFSPLANLIPGKSGVKGQRVAMGARMLTQALPLVNAESQLVQTGIPGTDESYQERYGSKMGAVFADKPGQVEAVDADSITIRHEDGTTSEQQLYNWMPMNRKTLLHNTAVVKPGDRVGPGQLLARSNYTDDKGRVALGINLRTAYVPFRGRNFEDANVISRSAAEKLASEHLYQHDLEWGDGARRGKNAYISLFANRYDRKALDTIDDDGVIKPGTVVNEGHPLVLMARERERSHGQISRSRDDSFSDGTLTWDHHDPGVVTDVAKTKNGVVVAVKSINKTKLGDKLAGLVGDKGIIAHIEEDENMPVDKDGKPFEILVNPLGIITRTNPIQVIEAVLGKIAAATGKPYKLHDFDKSKIDDLVAFAESELAKNGMTDTEDITDPVTGRKIKGVLTGQRYLLKLHHTSEAKGQGRGLGGYTSDEMPARGGSEGSKRVSVMDLNALLSHGAMGVIRDVAAIKGQRNDDWWSAYMQGQTPPEPSVPIVHRKFYDLLRAGAINPVRRGGQVRLMAMTNKDIDHLAGDRHIQNVETVDWKEGLKPIKGGLFDPGMTGGHGGCFHPETRIFTRQGWVSIGHIVNRKLPVEVLSFDFSSGKLEYKRVVNFFRNETDKPLLRVKYSGGGLSGVFSSHAVFNSIYCTPNHAFYREDGTKVRAEHLSSYVLMPTCLLGSTQKQALYGTVLGDASLVEGRDGNCCLSFQHGLEQERYLRHKAGLFSGFAEGEVGLTSEKAYWTSSYTAEFGALKRAWYGDNGKKLPDDFRDVASKLTLALWFFDDGWSSWVKGKDYAVSGICTESFSDSDVEKLRLWLLEDFGLITSTSRRPNGGNTINMAGASTLRLFSILRDICPEGMEYKLKGVDAPHWSPLLTLLPETAVVKRPLRLLDASGRRKSARRVKYVYDIEVEGNHNYFANGVLVSNSRWSAIPLHEPMVNPVMEGPVRLVLGLTEKKFEEILSGREKLDGYSGPKGLKHALDRVNLDQAIQQSRLSLENSSKSSRDGIIKRLKLLTRTKALGLHPRDWILNKVPVLPPIFRPVSVMSGNKLPMVADPNYLYKEVFEANENLKHMSAEVDDAGEERLALYRAFKGVTGLGDPIQPKNQERQVKGVLKGIFGSSPKFGMVQRKLLGSAVDLVGRAVIAPNPDLDMDSVGLPETKAWDIYRPFLVRRLVTRGMTPFDAARAVQEKNDHARQALQKEMEARPVIVTRAPVLHRYGVMAFWPQLVKGEALQVPPTITKSFAADFDGDAMNYSVPVSDDAVKDAVEKMLPSRNLLSTKDFRPHYVPQNEYQGGLYTATSRSNDDKPERVFQTRAAMIKALRSGEIDAQTRIVILQPEL